MHKNCTDGQCHSFSVRGFDLSENTGLDTFLQTKADKNVGYFLQITLKLLRKVSEKPSTFFVFK